MKISTHAPHAYEPSASELDSTLKFNEVLCKHVSQRLSSNDQIRTNINVCTQFQLRRLIAMLYLFIMQNLKTTKKCNKIALHRMVRFFFLVWWKDRMDIGRDDDNSSSCSNEGSNIVLRA
jgi:hypothetical protein